MALNKESILQHLIAAYTGPGSTEEGSFAGDVLRSCADMMAELYSTEIDGLEYRAFVSTAVGDWLTRICADRGVERREGESDDALRVRTLAKLSRLPSGGNADHYAIWCAEVPEILRTRVLSLNRGNGTVDIVAVDTAGKAPAPAVLAAAQQLVDANRPIGADAQVIGVVETPLDISASLILLDDADLSDVSAAFENSLATFCLESALRTNLISYAKVLRLLLDTPGVADVLNFTLNGGTASLSLSDDAAAVPGTIRLSEVSQ